MVIWPVVILPRVMRWEMQLEMLNEVFSQILGIAMLQTQANRLAVEGLEFLAGEDLQGLDPKEANEVDLHQVLTLRKIKR